MRSAVGCASGGGSAMQSGLARQVHRVGARRRALGGRYGRRGRGQHDRREGRANTAPTQCGLSWAHVTLATVIDPLPVLLIPGLLASARLYAEQIPALWQRGPVMVADPIRDDTMAAIAARILAGAPPVFALAGLSMGGYVCFEIARQAPQRIARLALLDTSARPDTPDQSAGRRAQVALASQGRLAEVLDAQFARLVGRMHREDGALRALVDRMAEDVGVAAFIRQQTACMGRADSRPLLGRISCPTLVLVGEDDEVTPPARAAEIAHGIDGARLLTVRQCGHLSTLEQPAEVTRALLEWLSG
jgi:pimeloyl-ACP methyl ester carboxylesterase